MTDFIVVNRLARNDTPMPSRTERLNPCSDTNPVLLLQCTATCSLRSSMSLIDYPGEWLRLSEHYRRMTDGELMAIARGRDQLTEIAQQTLAMELSGRGLKVEA